MDKTPLALVATLGVAAYTAISAMTAAFGAPTAGTKLFVSAVFAPDPPSTNGNDKIIITVKDAAGSAVHGARVKIATSMPTMSMQGDDIVARDHGDGTYVADAKLGYATKWAFDVSADAQGQRGEMHVERTLK